MVGHLIRTDLDLERAFSPQMIQLRKKKSLTDVLSCLGLVDSKSGQVDNKISHHGGLERWPGVEGVT